MDFCVAPLMNLKWLSALVVSTVATVTAFHKISKAPVTTPLAWVDNLTGKILYNHCGAKVSRLTRSDCTVMYCLLHVQK